RKAILHGSFPPAAIAMRPARTRLCCPAKSAPISPPVCANGRAIRPWSTRASPQMAWPSSRAGFRRIRSMRSPPLSLNH
ncbi:hypothetical protein LTR94_035644, partial [Friedmanniomyces endolithicus]